MRQNEHKYQGFLSLPGDISRKAKIALVEGKKVVADGVSRAFRAMRKERTAKLQRQRDKDMIRRET